VIRRHGGFIESYGGHGARALFDDPARAAAAGCELVETLRRLAEAERGAGRIPVATAVALHRGRVLLGTVGEPDRLESLVLGEALRFVDRLQRLNAVYATRLLVSEAARAAGGAPPCAMRRADRVRLAGTDLVQDVYQTLPDGALGEALAAGAGRFEEAFDDWRRGRFAAALAGFRACLEAAPADVAARVWAARCERQLAEPPAGRWEGVRELLDERRSVARPG